MENENGFSFELRVASTGETFSFVDVPYESTAKDIIDNLMKYNKIVTRYRLSWTLLYSGKILPKDTIIFKLINENIDPFFELIAKVEGA